LDATLSLLSLNLATAALDLPDHLYYIDYLRFLNLSSPDALVSVEKSASNCNRGILTNQILVKST